MSERKLSRWFRGLMDEAGSKRALPKSASTVIYTQREDHRLLSNGGVMVALGLTLFVVSTTFQIMMR